MGDDVKSYLDNLEVYVVDELKIVIPSLLLICFFVISLFFLYLINTNCDDYNNIDIR